MSPHASSRFVLHIGGADARVFLQDLITNTLAPTSAGRAIYAGLLTPQGKVIADFFVLGNDAEGYVLDVTAGRAEHLAKRLTLFVLRRAVTIQGLERPPQIDFADPRRPDLPPRQVGIESMTLQQRLDFGLPNLATDAAPEDVFALEALFEELNGVDFHKGCFVGQENVSRMKRRATTRRKFCRIRFSGPAIATMTPVLAGETELGAVRASVEGRGLALLRLDRASEAVQNGLTLMAGETPISLDPPDWLIMPQAREDGAQS